MRDIAHERRAAVRSACLMYGGAGALSILQGLMPGGDAFSPISALGALAVSLPLLRFGRFVPTRALWLLGPIAVVLIAIALATSGAVGDGAVLYLWPVIWVSLYCGRSELLVTVLLVIVCHGVVLVSTSHANDAPDRLLDVGVSSAIVAASVHGLVRRNRMMLAEASAQARRDSLTGLLNRRGFSELRERELARSIRTKVEMTAIAIDIDDFKDVNDVHGHEAGDRLLQRVGALIAQNVRGSDLAARVGGDEFVILLTDGDLARAENVADRIRTAAAAALPGLPDISISAGVATGSPDPALFEQADRALYAAKDAGRDRVHVFAAEPAAACTPASSSDSMWKR